MMARTLNRVVVCRLGGLSAALALLAVLVGCDGFDEHTAQPAPVATPPLVRRLTEAQYRASITDIFGPTTEVRARFETPFRAHGLIAAGSSEAAISAFALEQFDAAARGIVEQLFSDVDATNTLPCRPAQSTVFDAVCGAELLDYFGPRILRRPLTPSQRTRYLDIAESAFARLDDNVSGVSYALIALLVSPEFLFRIERPWEEMASVGELDAYSKAARLSFFLTLSTPDEALLEAAAAGELDTPTGLEAQVDRLMASAHLTRSVEAFFRDMLRFDEFDALAKDPIIYPAYNSTVAHDAQQQTLKTIDELLLQQTEDYRTLFTTRAAWLTRSLGVIYRVPVPTRNGWERQAFAPDSGRFGIQSHVSFMALHAHPGRSSATLRGKALREIFLCQEVPDPPANVNFAVVQDPDNATMPTARDRLVAHRNEPSCAGCHKITDPVGLSMENFDGIGGWRWQENKVDIDVSGELDGQHFNSPEGIAQALSTHPETPRCLVEKLYRYAVGRDVVWGERAYLDYLNARFAESGYRLPDLMRTIALSQQFYAVGRVQASGPADTHIASAHTGGQQ